MSSEARVCASGDLLLRAAAAAAAAMGDGEGDGQTISYLPSICISVSRHAMVDDCYRCCVLECREERP